MPEESATDLVRDDVVEGLGAAFEPTTGFAVLDALAGKAPATADDVTFVPWQYGGLHVGSFHGVAPTGRAVLIVGTTAVDVGRSEEPEFHRFVDWANVFAQLGLTVNARPFGAA